MTLAAPTTPPLPLGLPLRDGSEVVVRPIEPSDSRLLRAGFERLSEESRFRRFLSPMPHLSEATLRYLTEVDHHDHEALVAIDPGTGHAVGVARYVRTGPDLAEAAVTVADDWQGRGLGTALLELLSACARGRGIGHFSGLILETNADMLALLRRLGPVTMAERGQGSVEVVAQLPPDGLGPHLRELLRMAAREHPVIALAGAPR